MDPTVVVVHMQAPGRSQSIAGVVAYGRLPIIKIYLVGPGVTEKPR